MANKKKGKGWLGRQKKVKKTVRNGCGNCNMKAENKYTADKRDMAERR